MGRYVKIPVEIEAWQWKGAAPPDNTPDWLLQAIKVGRVRGEGPNCQLKIETLEGIMTAGLDDWVIKGVKGEIYPCKPDIFEATYRPAAPIIASADLDPTGEMQALLESQPNHFTEMPRSLKQMGETVYRTTLREAHPDIDLMEVEEVDPKTHPRGEPIACEEISVEYDSMMFGLRDMQFLRALEGEINSHSRESRSDTPDFVLATFAYFAIDALERAIRRRDQWHGWKEKISRLEAQIAAEGAHTTAAQARIEELEQQLKDARRNSTGG